MIGLLFLAKALAATSITVGGLPVEVRTSNSFGEARELSVSAVGAPTAALHHALLEAAARRTIADGRRGFTIGSRIIGTGTETRLEEVRGRIHASADGSRLILKIQEVGDDPALLDQSVDAAQALAVLGAAT
ncbi:hypothetical protein BH09PSE2_BH09PSE2_07630 [soil metagenome]